MSTITICPCGIAKDDCDYHKPGTEEYFAGQVYKNIEYVYTGNGQWEIQSVPDPKMDALQAIAERVGDYHQAQVRKALQDAFYPSKDLA
jgi:hypothetical protein